MPQSKRKRGASPATDSKELNDKKEDSGAERKVKGRRKAAASGRSDSNEKPKEEYHFWLMKSEPESRIEKGMDMKFGIEDLKAQPDQRACWDGVRNYQARNFLRQMKVGQEAFFYHSNCKEPGIAGIVKIVKEAYPDHTQFDTKNPHYDASSSQENPKWSMVDVQFVRMLGRYIPVGRAEADTSEAQGIGWPSAKHGALYQSKAVHTAPHARRV
ncbi:unnamed protein product [Staurois parvus]|uniref:Thymocyte nuclear protein 1 n=1 Tax=Staurois parvus TaxID=386267 RepID=A0ABN9HW80_9NEOB|nr:unnamed protein product [Staurois parvus]